MERTPFVSQIAEYIFKTACESTETGEWSSYAEDICQEFKITEDVYFKIHGYVVEELMKYDGIIDLVDVGSGTIDMTLDVELCLQCNQPIKVSMCKFCTELKNTVLILEEHYEARPDKHNEHTEVFEAALVQYRFYNGEPTGKLTCYGHELNFCPSCGRKIEPAELEVKK